MTDFSLTAPDLQNKLFHCARNLSLNKSIRPEQIILCIGKAYRAFGLKILPEIIETQQILIPFYVFLTEKYMRTIPAVGLSNRLFKNYQFKASTPVKQDLNSREDEVLFQPDVPLATALERAGPDFTALPTDTVVRMMYVPFYKVLVKQGQIQSELVINAFNGDVLIEHPPPRWSKVTANSSLFTAIFTFGILVTVITSTWLLSGSMIMAILVAAASTLGIRSLLIRSLDKELDES